MNTFDIALHGSNHYCVVVSDDNEIKLYKNEARQDVRIDIKAVGARLISTDDQLRIHFLSIENTYYIYDVDRDALAAQDEAILDIANLKSKDGEHYTAIALPSGKIRVRKDDAIVQEIEFLASQVYLSLIKNVLVLAVQHKETQRVSYLIAGRVFNEIEQPITQFAGQFCYAGFITACTTADDRLLFLKGTDIASQADIKVKALTCFYDNSINAIETAALTPENEIIYFDRILIADRYKLKENGAQSAARSYRDTMERAKDEIGEGTTSKVYQSIFRQKPVALKVAQKEEYAGNVAAEIEILSTLQHRNLIALHGFFTSKGLPCMLLELAERGSLKDHISSIDSDISWTDQFTRFAYDLSSALSYIHENKIIHGDVKPANILVRKDYSLMLTDFGNFETFESMDIPHKIDAYITTLYYCAPECLTANPVISHKSDVYSFGCTLYTLVYKIHPFSEVISEAGLIATIKHGATLKMPGCYPNWLQTTINPCFFKVPDARPAASTLEQTFKERSLTQS